MTVFGHVNDHRFLPSEQEVTYGCSEHNGYAQPNVVSHEDQHQEVREHHLNYVEERLVEVHQVQHRWSAKANVC